MWNGVHCNDFMITSFFNTAMKAVVSFKQCKFLSRNNSILKVPIPHFHI